MKVVINGRFLTQPVTGVQRFAIEIVHAIDRLLEREPYRSRFSVSLLAPSGTRRLGLARIAEERAGGFKGYWWEQLQLPMLLRKRSLLNLCNLGSLVRNDQWVVMLDAAVFDTPLSYTLGYRTWHRFAMRCLALKGARILTISKFSRQALSAALNVDQKQIEVLSGGADHMHRIVQDDSILDRLGLRGTAYLVAIGSRNPNKNFSGLYEALALMPGRSLPMVIVGTALGGVFPAHAAIIGAGVIDAGYVSDEELKALLVHARWFVFPSLYEGFGLPPIEAMACGCPVITSSAASLVEVCGDAALYFDPAVPSQLASLLSVAEEDESLRTSLISKGHARAASFQWESSAEQLLNALYSGSHR